MQRTATILAAAATLAAASSAAVAHTASAPAPAVTSAAGAATARVVMLACTTGLSADARTAVYEGRMSHLPSARRMQMRFTLQRRHGASQPWAAVPGPGLGVWVSSAPGVSRYTFSKRIENLAAPATYRVLVRFRWLDADGHTLAGRHATSKVCDQPDLRPQLVARRIDVERAGDPDLRRYVVAVRNRGRTAAGPFEVGLDAAGPTASGHVVDLGPGASTLVSIEAPRCAPGSTLTTTVDPAEAVDEADESDNTLAVPCPSGAR